MAKKSTRLEALRNIFEENGISSDIIELNDSLIQDIKKQCRTTGTHPIRSTFYGIFHDGIGSYAHFHDANFWRSRHVW